MKYAEAIAYLTRCADDNGNHWYQGHIWSDVETCPTCHGSNDAGWLRCPGSRYGHTSAHCAPVAYNLARVWAIEDGSEITREQLDYAMGLVVNNSDVPARDIQQYAIALAGADVDAIVEAYLECQLWAQHDMDRDDNGNSSTLDENYSRLDISDEYVEKIRAEMSEVVASHPLAVRMYLNAVDYRTGYDRNGLFGHDFYLTREGHGAGFWDRGLGELGEYLTTVAKNYGSADDLWDNGSGVLA